MARIRVALCLYVFSAFLKARSGLSRSMKPLLRVLQPDLFEKRDWMALLRGDPPREDPANPNQMMLV